jgi:hypothetical protein
VKKHIASKLPRCIHREHECQSCIDNRHAHEPIGMCACARCPKDIRIRTAHCIYANLKRAK